PPAAESRKFLSPPRPRPGWPPHPTPKVPCVPAYRPMKPSLKQAPPLRGSQASPLPVAAGRAARGPHTGTLDIARVARGIGALAHGELDIGAVKRARHGQRLSPGDPGRARHLLEALREIELHG